MKNSTLTNGIQLPTVCTKATIGFAKLTSLRRATSAMKNSPLKQRFGNRQSSTLTLNERHSQIARARSYIRKIYGAVSGEGGHNQTFRVACILIQKFGLTYQEAFELLMEYNERCDPPWSIAEINHKLVDAFAQSGKPFSGALRNGDAGYKSSSPRLTRPVLRGTQKFTWDDIAALSRLRRIPPHGIKLAVDRGFLFRTDWHAQQCFGVHDMSGRLIELRRMDGKMFPAVPKTGLQARKSHAIKGSNKAWPLGIHEAKNFPVIALVEGIPDFLYAHYRVAEEGAHARVAVVAMLSASPAIDNVALQLFKNKTVRIFPHRDTAGLGGARKWQGQLVDAGTAKVDFFNLLSFCQRDGQPVKDLCDLTNLPVEEIQGNHHLKCILP